MSWQKLYSNPLTNNPSWSDSVHLAIKDPKCSYAAACGRHRGRKGGRYVTGLRTTSVAAQVDCVACQRTKAYKAALPEPKQKAVDLFPTMFAPGQRVAGFNQEATILRYDAFQDAYRGVWDDGKPLVLHRAWASKFSVLGSAK